MSIDFHRLMEPIDINRLIFIDYIDYIDCFPMIDFHRLDPSGYDANCFSVRLKNILFEIHDFEVRDVLEAEDFMSS